MAHIDHEGKVYCDWRLSVEGCEESEYFRRIYFYCLAASGFETVGMISCLVLRKLLLKETWRGFLAGESLLHVCTMLMYLSHFVQIACLVNGVPFPITGVLWSLLDVSKFLAEGAFVSATTQALPDNIIPSANWSLSYKTRSRLLSGYVVFTSIVHLVLLSTAYIVMETNLEQGKMLERAAMTLTSVNSVVLLLAHLIDPCLLKRRIQEVITETTESYGSADIDTSLLSVTNVKLTQVISFTFWSNSLVATNLLLLAYCPIYFTNMTMSKTIFILTYPLYFTAPLFYPCICLYFDIKKWLSAEKRTSLRFKKEDSALGHRSTFSGKENVEQAIIELSSPH